MVDGVAEQTVAVFKMRHMAEIEAKRANWPAQFDHIWSTRKENRLRFLNERLLEYQELIEGLYEHARLETETIRSVDPDAGDVPVDLDKFNKIDIQQRKILREIAEESGQLWSRPPAVVDHSGDRASYTVTGVDLGDVVRSWGQPMTILGGETVYAPAPNPSDNPVADREPEKPAPIPAQFAGRGVERPVTEPVPEPAGSGRSDSEARTAWGPSPGRNW
jgi:hypothetical protein